MVTGSEALRPETSLPALRSESWLRWESGRSLGVGYDLATGRHDIYLPGGVAWFSQSASSKRRVFPDNSA
jgi:hypothetical protein